MRRLLLKLVSAGTATIAVLVLSSGSAQADSALEYRVKAAFLYNFAKFVEWPQGSFSSEQAPVQLCLVGRDPFGEVLDLTLEGRTVNGREVVVERNHDLATLGDCHIVFVGRSSGESLARVMQRVGGTGVLTVGESDAFYDLGGIIRFVVDEGKVRFDVNAGEAELASLKVSSQLLKLARMVER